MAIVGAGVLADMLDRGKAEGEIKVDELDISHKSSTSLSNNSGAITHHYRITKTLDVIEEEVVDDKQVTEKNKEEKEQTKKKKWWKCSCCS